LCAHGDEASKPVLIADGVGISGTHLTQPMAAVGEIDTGRHCQRGDVAN